MSPEMRLVSSPTRRCAKTPSAGQSSAVGVAAEIGERGLADATKHIAAPPPRGPARDRAGKDGGDAIERERAEQRQRHTVAMQRGIDQAAGEERKQSPAALPTKRLTSPNTKRGDMA